MMPLRGAVAKITPLVGQLRGGVHVAQHNRTAEFVEWSGNVICRTLVTAASDAQADWGEAVMSVIFGLNSGLDPASLDSSNVAALAESVKRVFVFSVKKNSMISQKKSMSFL